MNGLYYIYLIGVLSQVEELAESHRFVDSYHQLNLTEVAVNSNSWN